MCPGIPGGVDDVRYDGLKTQYNLGGWERRLHGLQEYGKPTYRKTSILPFTVIKSAIAARRDV